MKLRQLGGSLPVAAGHQHLQVVDQPVEAVCQCQLGLGAADSEEVLQQGAAVDWFLDLGGQGTGHYSGY
jgi:hypothetical protein